MRRGSMAKTQWLCEVCCRLKFASFTYISRHFQAAYFSLCTRQATLRHNIMASQQLFFDLLGLPPEVRLIIYEFCILSAWPLPFTKIREPPRNVRTLRQICSFIRKEALHTRDDFIRLNAFMFLNPQHLDAQSWPAPSHIRTLLTDLHSTASLNRYHQINWRFHRVRDNRWYYPPNDSLHHLALLPNLQRFTIEMMSFEPNSELHCGRNYRKRLISAGETHCAVEAKKLMVHLPPLPKGFILHVYCAVGPYGYGTPPMHCSAVHRCLGDGAWVQVSTSLSGGLEHLVEI